MGMGNESNSVPISVTAAKTISYILLYTSPANLSNTFSSTQKVGHFVPRLCMGKVSLRLEVYVGKERLPDDVERSFVLPMCF